MINNADDALKVFEIGKKNRVTGSTNYNEHSSRSHLITMINIKGKNDEEKLNIKSKL